MKQPWISLTFGAVVGGACALIVIAWFMLDEHLFWDVERLILQLLFLGLLMRSGRMLTQLLQQALYDRIARELSIKALKETADELATRTASIAKAVEAREVVNRGELRDQLEGLDQKLDKNTTLTLKAAEASAEAAEVANSVNEKIANTNERLLEFEKHGRKQE